MCKKRILVVLCERMITGTDETGMEGVVVDTACLVCPALLLSSRIPSSFLRGTALPHLLQARGPITVANHTTAWPPHPQGMVRGCHRSHM